MNGKPKHPPLIEQKDALSAYFQALLQEPLEEEPQPEVELEQRVELPPVIAPPVIVPITLPVTEVQTKTPAVVEEGRPTWAEKEFQALLFKAGGLTLAVPLVELSGIQEWEPEKVTPMPGHIVWYLGLYTYRDRSVPIIDTAHLVLPDDRLQRLARDPNERLGRIVFIADGRWGLACDEVSEVITLTEEQVRWRSSRTKRRWLAGTVIEHMCALIDPPAFAEMLATGMEDTPGTDTDDDE